MQKKNKKMKTNIPQTVIKRKIKVILLNQILKKIKIILKKIFLLIIMILKYGKRIFVQMKKLKMFHKLLKIL